MTNPAKNPPSIEIVLETERIPVRPDPTHEYLLETRLVAQGYGVSHDTIRRHKQLHEDELEGGKHWVVQKLNTLGGPQNSTLWTKRGIIRLGFFIKSERAKRFRDAAEDLVIDAGSGRRLGAISMQPSHVTGELPLEPSPSAPADPLAARLDRLESSITVQSKALDGILKILPRLANQTQLQIEAKSPTQRGRRYRGGRKAMTLGVSMSPELSDRIDLRVKQLGFPSVSAYIREMVCHEMRANILQPRRSF